MTNRPFREILAAKQTPGEPRVRWWQNDYFDLFVWFEPGEEIWGFQLCYDRAYNEHALTWRREFGTVSHHAVDGSGGRWGMGTPILRAAKGSLLPGVVEHFERDAGTLPDECRTLIARVLSSCMVAKAV